MRRTQLLRIVFLTILLIVIWYIFFTTKRHVTYTITETGKVQIKNDRMRSTFYLKSNLHKTSEQSYNAVKTGATKAKQILDKSSAKNVSIKTANNAEYNYKDSGREFLGYRATVTITFEQELNEDTTDAVKLQSDLMSVSNGATMTLGSVNYYVSTEHQNKMKAVALERAITEAKRNADVLVRQTYPNKRYRIISVNVGGNGSVYQMRALSSDMTETNAVIEQGESTISATIDMTVEVSIRD